MIEFANIKVTPLVARISTLEKGEKITILLNPSRWHPDKLRSAAEICGFEIVEKSKYSVHLLCKYLVYAQPVHAVRGVVGVNREVASVKLPKHPRNLLLRNKGLRMKGLNDRAAHLQRLREWNILKRLRHKRRSVAEDYDRKTAKKLRRQKRRSSSSVRTHTLPQIQRWR